MRARAAFALLAAFLLLPGARVAGLIGPGEAATTAPKVSFLDGDTTRVSIPGMLEPVTTTPTTLPVAPAPDATTAPVDATAIPAPVTVERVTPASPFVAIVPAGGVDVFTDPSATRPGLHLSGKTEFGTPRVLLVLRAAGSWLEVLLPIRPNSSAGWVRAAGVGLSTSHDEIVVDLATKELTWLHDTVVVLRTPVAVGAPGSPTPTGDYFVTDVLTGGEPYGPFILALNGHSDTYTEFGGGDARLALHGTNDPSSIGRAASHGCVRLPNDLITELAARSRPARP